VRFPVRRTAWLVLVPLAAACATAGGSPPSTAPSPARATAAPAVAPTSSAVHWTRDSAEHDALLLQTYRWASGRLRDLAASRPAGTWAVILDADETILDNSEYQRERLPEGGGFTAESWAAWVRREQAGAIPGAKDFVALVHQLGGHVAIVTNRDDAVCPQTRDNIRSLGMVADVVLCKPPSTSDKNPRFDSVRDGTATADLPPLDVVMWVGDNIEDFPSLSQSIRSRGVSAYDDFGTRFVVLPNPMYGSWEANPWR
jgi:5'-nucleotidase (lipoprotein e(P4) family)